MRRGNNLRRNPNKSLSTESRAYGYIQNSTNTDDGRGGEARNWVNAHPDPHAMAILPLSSAQKLEYSSVNAEVTHLIKIRGEITVRTVDRIITIDSRIFEIETADDIQERGIVKWMICKELLV